MSAPAAGIAFLSLKESAEVDATNMIIMERVWAPWKLRVQALLAKP